jgi:hypothetical protein
MVERKPQFWSGRIRQETSPGRSAAAFAASFETLVLFLVNAEYLFRRAGAAS